MVNFEWQKVLTPLEDPRRREKAECVHTVCVDGGIRKTSKWICADRSRFDHNENDHTLSGDFHRQDQRRAQ